MVEYDLDAARSVLNSLKRQRSELLESNQLLRAKLQVLPCKFNEADEALRCVILARASFSNAGRQLQHQLLRDQASFLSIPPPSHWTGPWLQHFMTLSPEAHRFYLCTGSMHTRLLMQEPQPDEQRIMELASKRVALSSILMRFNPMAVMRNMNRHMQTGDPADEMFYSRVASLIPMHLFKAKGMQKLRSVYKLYKLSLTRLQEDRQGLHRELNSILAKRSCSFRESSCHDREGVASCCISEGGDSTDGHGRACRTTGDDEAQSKQEAIGSPRPVEDGLFRGISSSAPIFPVAPEDNNCVQLKTSAEKEMASVMTEEVLLTRLECNFATEMRERVQLCQFAASEAFHPLCVAYLHALSYPYLIEIPRVIETILELVETKIHAKPC